MATVGIETGNNVGGAVAGFYVFLPPLWDSPSRRTSNKLQGHFVAADNGAWVGFDLFALVNSDQRIEDGGAVMDRIAPSRGSCAPRRSQ